jgi:membrane protease YdiL (CAAX protease family)
VRWPGPLAVAAFLGAAALVTHLVAIPPVMEGVALSAVVLAAAALRRLGSADLGLARATWPAGARLGVTAGLLVIGAFVVALAVPALRDLVTAPPGRTWGGGVVVALVVIPLATVVPEELAFRGLLWGDLHRAYGDRIATIAASALFGLWHVTAALTESPANSAVDAATGAGAGSTALRVVGIVVVTALAGAVLAELRRRSGSLLAPALTHWALNGAGTLFVLAADPPP